MDRQSIPVAVAGFHWIIYRRHFMLCFGVLILIGSFHICRGVRRLPASLSGRRSFVVKMPRPHGNCKFQKRCESQPPENMPWESHVWSAQHQRCERAASSSVVNDVLAPQSRVTVPVLYWHCDHAWLWHLTVAIPSTSIVIDIGRPDSSCETGTFSTGKFAKSKTCFLILFYLISELVESSNFA